MLRSPKFDIFFCRFEGVFAATEVLLGFEFHTREKREQRTQKTRSHNHHKTPTTTNSKAKSIIAPSPDFVSQLVAHPTLALSATARTAPHRIAASSTVCAPTRLRPATVQAAAPIASLAWWPSSARACLFAAARDQVGVA